MPLLAQLATHVLTYLVPGPDVLEGVEFALQTLPLPRGVCQHILQVFVAHGEAFAVEFSIGGSLEIVT